MTPKKQPEGEVFGRHLRQLRMERELTQDALAQLVATSKPFISDMERGVKVPSLTMLLRLARALGCTACELVEVFDGGGKRARPAKP